jgi:hypothetical protein
MAYDFSSSAEDDADPFEGEDADIAVVGITFLRCDY